MSSKKKSSKKAGEPAGLMEAAKMIENLRSDILFSPLTNDYEDGPASSHILIALAHLEQAQHHFKLAQWSGGVRQETE
jgi:hypothetical protein